MRSSGLRTPSPVRGPGGTAHLDPVHELGGAVKSVEMVYEGLSELGAHLDDPEPVSGQGIRRCKCVGRFCRLLISHAVVLPSLRPCGDPARR
jgi:hypothetical protein